MWPQVERGVGVIRSEGIISDKSMNCEVSHEGILICEFYCTDIHDSHLFLMGKITRMLSFSVLEGHIASPTFQFPPSHGRGIVPDDGIDVLA